MTVRELRAALADTTLDPEAQVEVDVTDSCAGYNYAIPIRGVQATSQPYRHVVIDCGDGVER